MTVTVLVLLIVVLHQLMINKIIHHKMIMLLVVMLLLQEEVIKMVMPLMKTPRGSSYTLETLIMLPTNNVFVMSSVNSVLLLLKSFCRPNVVRNVPVALALSLLLLGMQPKRPSPKWTKLNWMAVPSVSTSPVLRVNAVLERVPAELVVSTLPERKKSNFTSVTCPLILLKPKSVVSLRNMVPSTIVSCRPTVIPARSEAFVSLPCLLLMRRLHVTN